MDQRDHGESGWSPDGRYGLERFSGDVVRIAEFLGRPPVLVGAWLGGNASLAALGHRPEAACSGTNPDSPSRPQAARPLRSLPPTDL